MLNDKLRKRIAELEQCSIHHPCYHWLRFWMQVLCPRGLAFHLLSAQGLIIRQQVFWKPRVPVRKPNDVSTAGKHRLSLSLYHKVCTLSTKDIRL